MFKRFGVYVLGKSINAAIVFILTPIFAQLLTQNDFGKSGMVSIIIALVSIIVGLGLQVSYSIKFYKVNFEERVNLRKSIVILTGLLYFLSLGAMVFAYNFVEVKLALEITLGSYLKIISSGYFLFLSGFLLEEYKLKEEAIKYNAFQILNSIGLLIISIGFISFIEASLKWYINGYFYSGLIFNLGLIIYEKMSKDKIKFEFNRKLLFELIKLGLPMVVGMLFGYGLNYADQFILKHVTSSYTVVGIYALGYKLGGAFNGFLVVPYLTASTPNLFRLYSENLDEYEKKLNILLRYFIGISFVYLIFLCTGIDLIFAFLFKDYGDAKSIVEIVTISYIINGAAQLIGNIIVVKEKLQMTVFVSALITVLNIVLNYIWIPKYGIIGAAVSTLFSYIVVLFSYTIYSRKLMKINLNFGGEIKFVIVSSLVVGVIKLIQFNNIWIGLCLRLIIALVYLIIVYKSEHFNEINTMLRRRIGKHDSM